MPILLEEFAQQLWSGDPRFYLPGSRKSTPLTLQALLKFNGIVINDRSVLDHYRIDSIDGFHGADIRHNAEENPGDHGETPLDNLLGGRTLLINGTIRSGNADRMSDLTQALRTAFYTMTEKPLVVSVSDVTRDVYISARMSDKLGLIEEQTNDEFERKFQITMRASDPRWRSTAVHSYSIPLGFLDDFSADTLATNIWERLTGPAGTVISSGTLRVGIGSGTNTFHLSGLQWEPSDSSITVKFASPATLATGHSIATVHSWVDVQNYLFPRVAMASSTLGQLQIWKRDSGTSSSLSTGSTFTVTPSTTYWLQSIKVGNDLTVSVFDSDPHVGSPTPLGTATHTLASGDVTKYGGNGGVGMLVVNQVSVWPIDEYMLEPLSVNHEIVVPRNIGNFLAQPTIRLWGPMTSITISNATIMRDETTGRFIKINGTIPDGSYYVYDAREGTLFDDQGTSKDTQLDISSKDILLENGDNPLTLTASNLSTINPRIEVLFSDTWV